jgi:hypothetical protein
VYKSGESRCDRCKRLSIDKCFCHPVNDASFLEETAKMLEAHVKDALDEGYKKLDFIASKSKIKTNPQMANKDTISEHIDFVPISDSEVLKFNELLKTELRLRLDRNAFISAMDGSHSDRRAPS